jgi:hypothetical protein
MLHVAGVTGNVHDEVAGDLNDPVSLAPLAAGASGALC